MPLLRPRDLQILAIAYRARVRSAMASARRRLGATSASTPLHLNNQIVLAAASKLGIGARSLPGDFLELELNGTRSRSRSADFDFEGLIPWLLCGDKALTSMILSERSLPVARHGCFTIKEFGRAQDFLRASEVPVVTKPARGTAGGLGITLGVTSGRELRRGFARAWAYSREVLVEEHVNGEHLRITVLDQDVLGVVRRLPARVVGDGRGSVKGLIEAKNRRLREGSGDNRMLCPIVVDAELKRVLRLHQLALGSVPAKGQTVQLRLVANADQGGEIEDVESAVHDDYPRMALAAADAVGATFCGVDLIVPRLARPAAGSGAVINEVNTTPSLYVINEPVAGAPSTNGAERVLRRLFDAR
jgi:D-alanine-D-alanine ligase-like ATP-grasp enzyme